MQFDTTHVQAQPFIRFAQANMDLLSRFSTSPEVTAQTSAAAAQMFQQASSSALKLMQSGAYSQLMQGMLMNYIEFLGEVSQSGMAMLSEGQAAVLRQAQQAADTVIDAAPARGRRSRHAA